jgi:hypothetical protein
MVGPMAQDGEATVTNVQVALLEKQLKALERPPPDRQSFWPVLLVVVGLVAIVGLGLHGYTAFATINRINVNARLETGNPILVFQDIATNGPRVNPAIDSSNRSTYSKALGQFLLDGTAVCFGITLVVAGVFVRANAR